MKIKTIMGLIPLICLVGCSSYKENFDCPIATGMGCASLSKVSKAMDQGHIQIEEPDTIVQHKFPAKLIVMSPRVVWGQSFTAAR